jgi:hypothetical protein
MLSIPGRSAEKSDRKQQMTVRKVTVGRVGNGRSKWYQEFLAIQFFTLKFSHTQI